MLCEPGGRSLLSFFFCSSFPGEETGVLPAAQGQVERNGHISPFLPLPEQPCQFQKLLSPMFLKRQVSLPPGHPWLKITLERKCFGPSVGQMFTLVAARGVWGWRLWVVASLGEHCTWGVLDLVLHPGLVVLGGDMGMGKFRTRIRP